MHCIASSLHTTASLFTWIAADARATLQSTGLYKQTQQCSTFTYVTGDGRGAHFWRPVPPPGFASLTANCRRRSFDGTHAASAFSMLVELMAIATSGLIGPQIDLPHG